MESANSPEGASRVHALAQKASQAERDLGVEECKRLGIKDPTDAILRAHGADVAKRRMEKKRASQRAAQADYKRELKAAQGRYDPDLPPNPFYKPDEWAAWSRKRRHQALEGRS